MKLWKKLKEPVKLLILVLLSAMIGAGLAFLYSIERSDNVIITTNTDFQQARITTL